ncbi:hypothetical protein [Cupriavidus necator]|uniref:hypothetical protein n=1 Tax=Cupriavidus necator TaxID=106590 RepID=UPI0027896335|nr:hypothetical protein [Cupriavidus necator]MDQ0142006.1 hypothetical protein [Cupriavidus necator]
MMPALLVTQSFPKYNSIDRMARDGTKPTVRLAFDMLDHVSLEKLKGHSRDMFWKAASSVRL